MGLLTVFFIFYWLWETKTDIYMWIILAIGIIGSVSLFLYFRQCRYYSSAIFFSVLSAYFYLNFSRSRFHPWLLSLSITLLLLASSLNYAAFMIVMLVDYFFWRTQNEKPLKKILPPLSLHLILLLFFMIMFNPLKTPNADYFLSNTFADRLRLLWLSVRDMNRCEFFPALILVALPIIVLLRKDIWILRGGVAFVIYVVSIVTISPQNMTTASFSDVRYFAPIIPLALILTVLILYQLFQKQRVIAIFFALLAFWTNLFHELGQGDASLRSTILAYAVELAAPPPEPYTPTVRWINKNVRPKRVF